MQNIKILQIQEEKLQEKTGKIQTLTVQYILNNVVYLFLNEIYYKSVLTYSRTSSKKKKKIPGKQPC